MAKPKCTQELIDKAAVTVLNGTNEGNYQAQPYMTLQSGILSEHVFEAWCRTTNFIPTQ